MDQMEALFKTKQLQDPEDVDALLELASLLREAVAAQRYGDINRIIGYAVENSYPEAFSWCVDILQEELEKEDCTLQAFTCPLGRSIPDYDELIGRLQVDFGTAQNGLEQILDSHGEVESFFNILVYQTGYPNVRFVSSENFDTKDNDYIQYKLAFVKA